VRDYGHARELAGHGGYVSVMPGLHDDEHVHLGTLRLARGTVTLAVVHGDVGLRHDRSFSFLHQCLGHL
jgi:hypothetical protein